ncbi:C39 family peptidase [Streptacidiphilus rugosus]|uniref:C39 family peptidase n=1 Tax=Streptacidiphilus rugosus TaxID=405783 RepID=UPI00055B2259|nr:C39 family peptidase [Streptacidiphilus rugosus]
MAAVLTVMTALDLAVLPSHATTRVAAAAEAMPWFHQQLRSDCEAAALRMVLAARGVTAEDLGILSRIGVDRVHPEFGHSGLRSGDPFRAFVGDPNGSEHKGTGYGVYAPPVARAARSYGLTVLAEGGGLTPAQLRVLIAAGHLAVIWTDFRWQYHKVHWYRAWDGNSVPYAGPVEHAVTVTGFSGDTVWVNDPYRGRYRIGLGAFTHGYATFGDMAVVVR